MDVKNRIFDAASTGDVSALIVCNNVYVIFDQIEISTKTLYLYRKYSKHAPT